MNIKTALYPGTFDPITNGHIDLVQRASSIFDRLVIAIAESSEKQPLFSFAERVQFAKDIFENKKNIEVCGFQNLLINFATEIGACSIIRGLRAVSDFEYEFQLAAMNRTLSPKIETIFLTPSEKYTFVSSSLVKEIARYGGDVNKFVPHQVHDALKTKYT